MVGKIKTGKYPKPSVVFPREVYMFRTSPKETEGTEAMKTRPGIVISVEGLNTTIQKLNVSIFKFQFLNK